MYVYKSMAESRVTNAALRAISLAAQSPAVSEGGKATVLPCVPLCAIFLGKPSVYPFSSVKANVGHLWEKLKIGMRNGWEQSCGGIFADFFSSADGEGSQRTGKCMYIKARWNKRDFAGSAKPHYVRRRECPCFGVQAAVCDPSPKAECVTRFHP